MPTPRIIKLKLTPNRPAGQNVIRRNVTKIAKKSDPRYLKTKTIKG